MGRGGHTAPYLAKPRHGLGQLQVTLHDFQVEIVLVVQAVGVERGNDNGTDTKREDDSTEHCVHPVR